MSFLAVMFPWEVLSYPSDNEYVTQGLACLLIAQTCASANCPLVAKDGIRRPIIAHFQAFHVTAWPSSASCSHSHLEELAKSLTVFSFMLLDPQLQ